MLSHVDSTYRVPKPRLVVVTMLLVAPDTTSFDGEAPANEQRTLRGRVPQPKVSSRQVAVQSAVVLEAIMSIGI